jgi:hypothetical protein
MDGNSLVDLTNYILQAQLMSDAQNCVPATANGISSCPGTTFNAITAAFATQGYWLQADLLWMFANTGFQLWTVLFYVVSAMGGIISMAMGAPPKMWVWFLIGPGLFHWLVEDTVPVHGVRWNVGPVSNTSDPSRAERAQREVWRLAEAGLIGTPTAGSRGVPYIINGDRQPEAGPYGNGKVRVSNLFVVYDQLLSDLSAQVIEWSGVFSLGDNPLSRNSNIGSRAYVAQRAGQGIVDNDPSDDEHWILSTMKWQTLLGVTGATLNSSDLRESFNAFNSGACGAAFKNSIDEGRFIMASNSRGLNNPSTVFLNDSESLGSSLFGLVGGNQYAVVTRNLATESMNTPAPLQRLLSTPGAGSFKASVNFLSSSTFTNLNVLESIRCDQYLHLLIHAFRWEAGHIAYQLIGGLPNGISPATMLYSLFHSWGIRELGGTAGGLGGIAGLFSSFLNKDLSGFAPVVFDSDQQLQFFTNLIFLHLFKNEYQFAPKPFEPRVVAGNQVVDTARVQMRTVGATSKFGELYTWALLIPYIQGVLMYLLAMAYPFCCMVIVVPGWHKVLITWMTFWAWIKLWDIGFAIVTVLERSVWSIIGNRSNASKLFSEVYAMRNTGGATQWTCPNVGGVGGWLGSAASFPATICNPEVVPTVFVGTGTPSGSFIPAVGTGVPGGDFQTWTDTVRLLDKAIAIGASMDLDLSNSYYVYIMSALYFAVPAVTGQLVLGAKAGAASLATNAMGSYASDAGRAAGGAVTGSAAHRGAMAKNRVEQGAFYNAMANDSQNLAGQALEQGVRAQKSEIDGAIGGEKHQALGQMSRVASHKTNYANQAIGIGQGLMTASGTLPYQLDAAMAASLGGGVSAVVSKSGAPAGSGASGSSVVGGEDSISGAVPAGAGAGTDTSGASKMTPADWMRAVGKGAAVSGKFAAGSLATAVSQIPAINSTILQGRLGYAAGMAKLANDIENGEQQTKFDSGQTAASMARAEANLYRGQEGAAASQHESEARQMASEASNDAVNAFGGSASLQSYAAGVGLAPGSFAAGARPMDFKGGIGRGMVGGSRGKKLQQLAQFSTGGAHSGMIRSSIAGLNHQYGPEATSALFNRGPSVGATITQLANLMPVMSVEDFTNGNPGKRAFASLMGDSPFSDKIVGSEQAQRAASQLKGPPAVLPEVITPVPTATFNPR